MTATTNDLTTTTIFGTGNMGSAIGGLLESAGHSVQHLDDNTPTSQIDGDVVVLAVPYEALEDIIARYGNQLDGRIVVDLTNPVDFDTFDSLKVPSDSSAAAELSDKVPAARIVKAFNTNFADTLSSRQVGHHPTTVLLASDDDDAKQTLAARLDTVGLAAIDAGPLSRAREMEALGFLQISLANREKIAWDKGFAIVTK